MNKMIQCIFETTERIAQRFEENDNLVRIGIVSGLAAVITACVATHKSEKIINETKETIIDIQNDEELTEEEKQKEIVKCSGVAAVKVAGWYSAVGCLQFTSFKAYGKAINNLESEKMVLASIAVSAMQRLVDYRRMWQEKVGKETEEEVYYGVEKQNVPILENGKSKKKKVRVVKEPPANKNILCFAPWTSDLYVDEDEYVCPGQNRKRIHAAIKTANIQLMCARDPYVSNNDIAELLQIKKSADWYTEGFIHGDNISFAIREVYALWEGKYIPIYYIELNSRPFLDERIKEVMPSAPDYSKEMAVS